MKLSKWRRASIILAIVALSYAGGAQAQDVCDPGLAGSSNSAMGYSMRGDRCEGIYALQVNSTDVRLASLVETFTLDLQDGTPLTVHWPVMEGDTGPVRLRAQSLRPRTYYRMDTMTHGATGSYAWPTEILGTLGLQRDEVGVLGWFDHELGSERREVYLPLRISQGDVGAGNTEYEIALIPDIRLREISVTLAPLDSEGVEGAPIIDKKPLDFGYYPAKEATVFNLPKPASPGLYKLELVCDRMPSGIATTTFWFYSE
jgi:hypothetical protein